MNNLIVLKARAERLRVGISEVNDIADDLDGALKQAAKVFTPKEIKESAERISQAAEQSAAHPRSRG